MTRSLKKTDTLELRIPHGAKQAFMARCAAEGRGASETMRMLIDGHMTRPVRAARRRLLRLLAAVAIAAGAGAVALPSRAAGVARTGYDSLDRNHDGAVSVAELAALDANRDGVVSLAEYRAP
jgi:hypothetical protein